MGRQVLVERDVLGGAAGVLEAIGGNDLALALGRAGQGHPYSPLAKELVVAALRRLRQERGGEWGHDHDIVGRIRAELAARPTVHLDVGGGAAILLETGRGPGSAARNGGDQ
ncbi:MAG: hypothetical protein MK116_13275 [Phycisphaerales bacterium]|nr:hypothetical protein [Phycisphaerales bacterium]